MKEVIVFGGGGLVGSSVIKQLKNSPYKIIAPSSKEVNLNSCNSVIDFANSLNKSEEQSISVIFIAAATPYSAVKHDDFDDMVSNANIVNNFRVAFADIRLAEIIYISTLDVYSKTNVKLTEDSPIGPTSNYAVFKLAGELLLKSFSKKKGIYGVNDKSPKVINKFFDAAFKTSTINISGNKENLRDFIYVEDVAKVIAFFVGKCVNETVNIATGRAVSLDFLAKQIGNCFSENITINYSDLSAKNDDLHFDIEKLRKYYSADFTKIEDVIPLLFEKKRHDYFF